MGWTRKIFTFFLSAIVITSSSTIVAIPILSNKLFQENVTKYDAFFKERPMFRNNDEIRHFFVSKKRSDIEVNDHIGEVEINVDSYQQSNDLSHTTPINKINFNYNITIRVNFDSLFTKLAWLFDGNIGFLYFSLLFNNSKTNSWSYTITDWEAKAGKRYMGSIWMIPMFAGEVKTFHKEKTYTHWSGEKIESFIDIIVDNLINNVLPKMRFTTLNEFFTETETGKQIIDELNNLIKGIGIEEDFNVIKTRNAAIRWLIKNILTIFKNSYTDLELKPNIVSIDGKDTLGFLKLKKVDFGNVHVMTYDAKNMRFKANHILPLIDYTHDYKCLGPICGHNLRHLIDVVVTSVVNLILENFGDNDNLINRIFTAVTMAIVDFILMLIYGENVFFPASFVLRFINEIWDVSLSSGAIGSVLPYINKNMGDLLFALLGKVEKHGIQLGKCGDLISGIKVDADDNIIDYVYDKKFVMYSNDDFINKIFNENGYNLNTIQCIVEMKNYKDLNSYINSITITNSVKNKLIRNIKNLSLSSKAIYDQLLNYLDNGVIPTIFQEQLNSFKLFKADGWLIPSYKSIDNWDLLCDYILPDFFDNSFYLFDGTKQVKFFENLNFMDVSVNSKNDMYFSENDAYEFMRMV